MWCQPLTISAIFITIQCHTPLNDTDVIISYAGHSEVEYPLPPKPDMSTTTPEVPANLEEEKQVVFVPNHGPNDDVVQARVNIDDVLHKKSVSDILNSKDVRIETELPQPDILFIQGKNKEKDSSIPKNSAQEPKKHNKATTTEAVKLDCSNLDCNNTMDEVCGGKTEHSQWRYRLFLNECFFRKVNCNFRYEENRFTLVPIENCKPVGAHYPARPPAYQYYPSIDSLRPSSHAATINKRRSFVSRRSLNVDLNGQFCSHPCPPSCPEHYEPECAVSSAGIKQVFVNHCKLDYSSCFYGTAWFRRPLAECVGGRKADMATNGAFIGWMQKVGIVDNKGRLTLN